MTLAFLVLSSAAFAGKPDEPSVPSPDATVKVPGMTPVVGRNLTYVVKPGEDLYTLGVRYHLAIEHLMWANGLSSERVKPGTKIIIPLMHVLPATLEEGLVINLPERGVYLFKNHECVAFYPCAIGMGGRFATPTGDTRIVNKQVDPTWTPPDWAGIKEPIGPGPNNPLGDRWIGLGMDGVGLHGTTDPMSIGQNASHGCMRMYPSVVRILFDEVKVGMPVRVIYEPVKLGINPEDNKIYVQVYPDVYGRVPDKLAVLQEKLQRAGLAELVDEDQLKRLVADKTALPQHLLGDDIVIKVNNRRVSTTLAPFLKDGQIWTSSDVLRAIGAQVRYKDKVLTVSLKGKELRFDGKEPAVEPSPAESPSGSPDAADPSAAPKSEPSVAAEAKIETFNVAPRLWNGKSIIPVKPVLTSFGLTYKWLPKYKTLLIYCPDQDATL
jgi:L,D-transpeptidase ErfK/SrfK